MFSGNERVMVGAREGSGGQVAMEGHQRDRGQGPRQGQGKWEGGREEVQGRKVSRVGLQGWEEARPGRWSEGDQV